MGAEIARLQRKQRNNWQRVTNTLVMQFADPECTKCDGVGAFTVSDADAVRKVMTMCDCCDSRFKETYAGRLRRTKEGRLEFKPMATAEILDVRDNVEDAIVDAQENGTGIFRVRPIGRTADSEPANPGSNPGPETTE